METNWKTVVAVITGVILLTAAAVLGWASLKRDVGDHTNQIAEVQKTLKADHDLGVAHTAQIEGLARTLNRIENKLDRIRLPETVTTTTTETKVLPPHPP